jgi:hypothetical protein
MSVGSSESRGAAPLAPTTALAAPAHARVPDFFIVGQPKSGTTALSEMLRRHPAIYMPASKEPWFFATELLERTPPRPGGTPQTLEEYLSWFVQAAPEQRMGEASPLYLWSRTAAARIASVCPHAKIVAILREPAALLRSLHLQFLESHVETEADFRRAIALEDARRAGRRLPRHSYWPRTLLYSEQVRYVEQLRRYEAVFAPEQMLVMIYDDFKADNESTVRRVLRFLDVEDAEPIEVMEANPTVGVRSQRLNELVHALSVGRGPVSRAIKAAIKVLTPDEMRRGAVRAAQRNVVYREPPPPDESFMLELRRRFKGEVVALSEHLDRDLVSLWGYDGLQ